MIPSICHFREGKIKNEESKIVVGVTHKNYRKCFLQTDDDIDDFPSLA